MKAMLEIPDDLCRAVKAKAALEGLQLVLQVKPVAMTRVPFPFIKSKPGGRNRERRSVGLRRTGLLDGLGEWG